MMQIGQLAAATSEHVRTLRYWQDEGLLEAQRTDGGYRLFPDTMVEQVRFLRKAQALGLTLAEIHDVLTVRLDGRPPCERVRELLHERLASVRERVRELRALEDELAARLVWAEARPEPACDAGCVYLTDDPTYGSTPAGSVPRLDRGAPR